MPNPTLPADGDPVVQPRPRPTMHIRVDRGSTSGDDIAPGRGSLLKAFAMLGRTASQVFPIKERRSEPRHKAVECLAWVGWKVWRNFKMTNALVINISRSGAQIFMDAPPPSRAPIWVFLETPTDKQVVKAEMHNFRETPDGQCMANVRFTEPCPYAFFEAAVCGQPASDPKNRIARAASKQAKVG